MRNSRVSISKIKIFRWDWLLIIGLILAPMTGLRIWKIGPAEVLVLIWCLKYIPRLKIHDTAILRFFGLFLGSMALGTIWGLFVAREEVVLSGWFTWIYMMFVSIGLYEGLRCNTFEYNERMLRTFAYLAALWNIVLYVLARAGRGTFLGAPLWYYHRYSAGGTNPHQIAIMMCGIFFILLREFILHRNMLFSVILMIASGTILLATESSTALLALVLGILIELYVAFNNRLFGAGRHFRVILVEGILTFLVLVVFYQLIARYAYDWIAGDTNGLGRLKIFSNIKNTFMLSPLVGLGPGMHSRGKVEELIEYHNTYLEVIAAAGMVGLYALAAFTVRLLKKIRADNTYLAVVVSMYAYGLAGFGMRRLLYWGIIVFIYVITEERTLAKKQGTL
jgi:O-antigen ligase